MNMLMKGFLYPVEDAARLIFFAGKGGVGKTTVACATAVKLAAAGLQTLLITTDPASHLSEVFEQFVDDTPSDIKGVAHLKAVRIDQKKAADEYKERVLSDARVKYSSDVVAVMREQLDSPCTEEMASFNKFIDYANSGEHHVLIFDTAPTGHTLRLLELPLDWSQQLEVQAGVQVAVDDMSRQTKERYDKVIAAMRDPKTTSFAFVLYPEHTPIMEAWRAAKELSETGITTSFVVANNILPEEVCRTPFFVQRREMQQSYLGTLHERFGCPVIEMPLFSDEVIGIDMLKDASDVLYGC